MKQIEPEAGPIHVDDNQELEAADDTMREVRERKEELKPFIRIQHIGSAHGNHRGRGHTLYGGEKW